MVLKETSRREGRIIKKVQLIKQLIGEGDKQRVKEELSGLLEEVNQTLDWVNGLIAEENGLQKVIGKVA